MERNRRLYLDLSSFYTKVCNNRLQPCEMGQPVQPVQTSFTYAPLQWLVLFSNFQLKIYLTSSVFPFVVKLFSFLYQSHFKYSAVSSHVLVLRLQKSSINVIALNKTVHNLGAVQVSCNRP